MILKDGEESERPSKSLTGTVLPSLFWIIAHEENNNIYTGHWSKALHKDMIPKRTETLATLVNFVSPTPRMVLSRY